MTKMATIVYEREVAGGGDLFSGLKFYFLQRVPMRQTYMEAVMRNGGEIVKLEKLADIIIADHARKDIPVGSISWTFIDQSVAKGRLEDVEKHRAGPATHTVREVGSAQPTRAGRTPFTAQDDRDLMIWVTKAERNGVSTKGNDLYKQLEAINPRHTFQSWRDRWIKYLSDRPRPELSEEDLAEGGNPFGSKYSNHLPPRSTRRALTPDENMEVDSNLAIKQEPETQTSSTASRSGPKPSASASTPKPSGGTPKDKSITPSPTPIVPLVRKSAGGMIFTDEETDFMIEYYEVMADADQKRGINAWAKFATENPNHSAQEWHNYFVQTIKPLMQRQVQNLNTAITPIEQDVLSTSMARATSSKQPRAQSSKDLGYDVQTPEMVFVDTQISFPKVVDPSTKDEKVFIEDLTVMAEQHGLVVNFEPIICGRNIPLFKLWQVVNSEEFGGYDEVTGRRLWSQVTRKLNFNEFKHTDAPKAVQSAYEEILADFEVVREEYLAQLQEEAMIEFQLRAEAARDSMEKELVCEETEGAQEEEDEGDDYDDDLEAPASVPRSSHPRVSGKRSYDNDHRMNQDGSPVLGIYNKRQRIDDRKGKEKEIPSTPEDVINASLTPHPTYQPSPLKHQRIDDQVGSDEELFVGPVKKPNLPTRRKLQQNLEPETQDFNFNFQPVDDDDAETQEPINSLPKRRTARYMTTAPARSSPHEDSSTQSLTASQIDEELIAFIDRHIALGYTQEIVIEALESTNMTTGNAAFVMEELSQGNGIPEDIQGVWTASDDAALEDVESEEFEIVAMKHGTKSVALRQKFLAQQRESRRILGTE